MKIKSPIIVTFAFVLMILSASFASAQDPNIWGVEEGDVFEWNMIDEYYTIPSYSNTENKTQITRTYIDSGINYKVEYETVKDWTLGDLSVNASSTKSDTDSISIIVNYYILGGSGIVERNYTNYGGEKIITIIPSEMGILAQELYREPYTTQYGKDVETIVKGNAFVMDESGNYISVSGNDFATVGSVSVLFANSTNITHTHEYYFHYVSNIDNVEKDIVKRYDGLGTSIEIINIEDYGRDGDENEDILILSENSASVETPIGDYGVSIPNYVDISTFTNLVSIIGLISGFNTTEGSIIPVPTGFTLPSGMNVVHSNPSNLLKSLINISPVVMEDFIVPIINLQPPNIASLFNALQEEEFSLSVVYGSLVLISYTNFLILPTTVEIDSFGDVIDSITESLESLELSVEGIDLSNIEFLLGNIFDYSEDGDMFEIRIDSKALPLLYDSKNGLASIEMSMGWNGSIFDHLNVEINYIQSDFGHVIGFEYNDPTEDGEEIGEGTWTKQLTNFIIILFSLLGGGGVGIVYKKKKRQKNIPFKSAIKGMRKNNDCPNGFCPD